MTVFSSKIIEVAIVAVAVVANCGCNRVPDYVIQPEDMAQLLADIHTADGVVESNYQQYSSDSARLALKQAVFEHRGVTAEQVDTSMVWYGAHLDRYMKVYDRAEEILNDRLNQSSAVAAAESGISVSGDSVDIWQRSPRFSIDDKSATDFLTFNFKADQNTRSGDQYTWRVKFYNNNQQVNWGIVADYSDGTIEALDAQFSSDGWQTLNFYTDSTRTMTRVYGYLRLDAKRLTPVYLDSIQLVRKRLTKENYMQRYRQRHYNLNKNSESE